MSNLYSSACPTSYAGYMQKKRENAELISEMRSSTKANIAIGMCIEEGIRTTISEQTNQIIASNQTLGRMFGEGLNKVDRTLNMGFAAMCMGFSSVEDGLKQINATLITGFQNLENTINTMSEKVCGKLDEIRDIMNNPRLTAARELYNSAVKNARNKFFKEAMEDVNSAIEKEKTDYMSWFLKGQLELYGEGEFSSTLNLAAAAESLKSAYKYISPYTGSSDEAKELAGQICHNLSFALYAISNDARLEGRTGEASETITSALKYAEAACNLCKSNMEYAYHRARCHALLGDKDKALELLETVIKAERLYALKASSDEEFEPFRDEFFDMINKMKMEMYPRVKNLHNMITWTLEKCSSLEIKLAGEEKEELEQYYTETCTEEIPYFEMRDKFEHYEGIFTKLNSAVLKKREELRRQEEERKRKEEKAKRMAEAKTLAAERMEAWKRKQVEFAEKLPFFSVKKKRLILECLNIWEVAQGEWQSGDHENDKSIFLKIEGFQILFKSSKCKRQDVFIPSQKFVYAERDTTHISYKCLSIEGEFSTEKIEFDIWSPYSIYFKFPSEWSDVYYEYNRLSIGLKRAK